MTEPSSNAIEKNQLDKVLREFLMVFAALALMAMLFFLIKSLIPDPFVKETLYLEGQLAQGARLFRINCAGCHGISAQGLLGPNLHKVSYHLNDSQIIHQIIQGRTPPMPSFEMEPQKMADLLKYLHSIN